MVGKKGSSHIICYPTHSYFRRNTYSFVKGMHRFIESPEEQYQGEWELLILVCMGESFQDFEADFP